MALVLGLAFKLITPASVLLSSDSSTYVAKEDTKPNNPVGILLYIRAIMKASTALGKGLITVG